jgi:hypothetical protein
MPANDLEADTFLIDAYRSWNIFDCNVILRKYEPGIVTALYLFSGKSIGKW